MKTSTHTLSQIIEGCKQNNRLMQKALYEQFAPKMYAVCLRYTKHEEDAQDVLQNAFVKIFAQLNTYLQTGVLEAWMRRIVVHTAIEFLRKKNVRFEELPTDSSSDHLNLISEPHSQMEFQDVFKHIQFLPDGYRTVFNMYVMEDMTHQEIADVLSISLSTSKSQLSRARVLLQQLLKKEMEVEKYHGN